MTYDLSHSKTYIEVNMVQLTDTHSGIRICFLTRRLLKILALWEDHSFKWHYLPVGHVR